MTIKSKLATLCLACALPLAALAEPQAPKRNDPRATPGGAGGGGGFGGDRMNRGGGGGDWGNRERDLTQFNEFCKEHAHNRWLELQEPGRSPNKQRLFAMVMKFHTLLAIEKEDKELYDIKVRQIEVEDVEYGLMKKLREAEKVAKADKSAQDKLKAEIRANSEKYVDLRLKERGRRIERLKKLLGEEEKSLAADTKTQDRLVTERLNLMLASDGLDFFNAKPTRRPGSAPGNPNGEDENPIPPTTNAAPTIP